ncbi:unnamed protein product [marine sediment metagenome]|uniref:Uncharacterized protein n=1 Tax=marine sediment metagenome TaxID=412755 RepID=X1T6G0_9ZZZZ
MNDEARKSRSIKIRPSILKEAHERAKREGQTVGRWIEDAIVEKIEREQKKVK